MLKKKKLGRLEDCEIKRLQDSRQYKLNRLICIFLWLIFCLNLYASPIIQYEQSQATGGLPGEYLLTFSGSARGLAMGKSYTALSDEPGGIYWNPAGSVQIDRKQFAVFYAPLFFGSKYNFLTFAFPYQLKDCFTFSFLSLTSEKLEKRSEFGDYLGEFEDKYNTYLITYSRRISTHFDFGFNLKFVSQQFDNIQVAGAGIDVGVIYYISPKLDFGIAVHNLIQPKLAWEKESDLYPISFRVGSGMKFFKPLLLSADLLFLPASFRWFSGLEYSVELRKFKFAVRGGINYKELTAGFGVATENISTDFAVVQHELGLLYNFSVSYSWGITKRDIVEIEKSKEAVKHYKEALRYYNAREYIKADEEISQALILLPEEQQSKELKLKIQKELDRIAKEKELQEAKEYLNKALEFFDRNQLGLAKENLSKCKNLHPELITEKENILFNTAKNLVDEMKYKEAMRIMLQVMFLNPENTEAKRLYEKVKEILEFIK